MLHIERSVDFWSKIIDHPSIGNSLEMTKNEFLLCVEHPRVTPLASKNGGYLIIDLGIGLISEFHGVFTEEGRGKEVFITACELAEIIFSAHDMAVTYETTNINSKPPLSFGFQSENNWEETSKGNLKLWYLTKSRWRSSPVYRRIYK